MNIKEAKLYVTQIVTNYNQSNPNQKKFLTKDLYYLYCGAFMYCSSNQIDTIKFNLINDLSDVQFNKNNGSKKPYSKK